MNKEERFSNTELVELTRQCRSDSERWFGDLTAANSIVHQSLGLAGETGEFCNIVKKIDRGSLSISDAQVRYDLAMELTDVLIYTLNLAGLLNINLSKLYSTKRAYNEKRFMEQKRERANHV